MGTQKSGCGTSFHALEVASFGINVCKCKSGDGIDILLLCFGEDTRVNTGQRSMASFDSIFRTYSYRREQDAKDVQETGRSHCLTRRD